MGKFNFKSVLGFLGHHAADLDAVAGVLEGIVGALPINAETRHNINLHIEKVRNSADNIRSSLQAQGVITEATPPDQEAALAAMLAEWMAAHPGKAFVAPQVAAEAQTEANNAANQPHGTTAQQQAPQEGAGATAGSAQSAAFSGTGNAASVAPVPGGTPGAASFEA